MFARNPGVTLLGDPSLVLGRAPAGAGQSTQRVTSRATLRRLDNPRGSEHFAGAGILSEPMDCNPAKGALVIRPAGWLGSLRT